MNGIIEICDCCVIDPNIKNQINEFGKIGKCYICESENKKVRNIYELQDIKLFFDTVFPNIDDDNEQTDNNSILDASSHILSLLKDFKLFDFGDNDNLIFHINISETLKNLINHYYPNRYNRISNLSNKLWVELFSSDAFNIWKKLLNEIRHKRRFFYTQNVKDTIFYIQKYVNALLLNLEENNNLYRGRIGLYDKLPDLCKPPNKKTDHLRASPYGISYLYLSDNEECCINECRTKFSENISIANFVNKERLNILDLSNEPSVTKICQIFEDDVTMLYKIIQVFSKLKDEMSKPAYDNTKNLDYIITQLFVEAFRFSYEINTEGNIIEGIRYQSSFDINKENNWFNYALFSSDKVELKTITQYKWIYSENNFHLKEIKTIEDENMMLLKDLTNTYKQFLIFLKEEKILFYKKICFLDSNKTVYEHNTDNQVFDRESITRILYDIEEGDSTDSLVAFLDFLDSIDENTEATDEDMISAVTVENKVLYLSDKGIDIINNYINNN